MNHNNKDQTWINAVELHKANRFVEALEQYTKVLANNPLHIEARNNRACIYDDLEMHKEAISDLNIVTALCPEYGDAYYNLGYINVKKKFYREAVRDYRISIGLRFPKYNPKDLVTLCSMNQINKGLEALRKLQNSGFYVRFDGYIGEKIIIMPRLRDYRIALRLKENKLHEGKTILRHLRQQGNRYELRFTSDLNTIFDRCKKHYNDKDDIKYLELLNCFFSALNRRNDYFPKAIGVTLYKDGKPVAGEIGIQIGKVYSSYTGYHDESSTGTVQLVLLARYLIEAGYSLWDFGSSQETCRFNNYKLRLGGEIFNEEDYHLLFQQANNSNVTT